MILGGPDPSDPYPYIHGTVYLSGFYEKKHFLLTYLLSFLWLFQCFRDRVCIGWLGGCEI